MRALKSCFVLGAFLFTLSGAFAQPDHKGPEQEDAQKWAPGNWPHDDFLVPDERHLYDTVIEGTRIDAIVPTLVCKTSSDLYDVIRSKGTSRRAEVMWRKLNGVGGPYACWYQRFFVYRSAAEYFSWDNKLFCVLRVSVLPRDDDPRRTEVSAYLLTILESENRIYHRCLSRGV